MRGKEPKEVPGIGGGQQHQRRKNRDHGSQAVFISRRKRGENQKPEYLSRAKEGTIYEGKKGTPSQIRAASLWDTERVKTGGKRRMPLGIGEKPVYAA